MKSSKKLISLIMAMAMLASAGMSFGAFAEAVDNSQASAIAQSIQDNGGADLEQEDGTIIPVDVEVSVKELGSSYTRSGEVVPRYAVTMTAYALKDENQTKTRSSATDSDSQYGCYGTVTVVYTFYGAGNKRVENVSGGWYGSIYATPTYSKSVDIIYSNGSSTSSLNYVPYDNTFNYNVNVSGRCVVNTDCQVYLNETDEYVNLHCHISV